MKRQISQAVTRSKRAKLNPGLLYSNKLPKIWVSATQTYNYMCNDTLVDVLKLKRRKTSKKGSVKSEGSFTDFIKQSGIDFEEKIVEYINNNIFPIIYVGDNITKETCLKTIELMELGTPIIHSAPVCNNKNKTRGIIDLLVRSDYISKIFSHMPDNKTVYPDSYKKTYHYVVIDIKFSTLPLRSDGIHLLNSGAYPAYKAQTWVYTKAIGEIQSYTSNKAYILGRRNSWKSKGIQYKSKNCLDRPGVINYSSVDKDYPAKTVASIKWVREFNRDGLSWDLNPSDGVLHRKELYPNMSKDARSFQLEKQTISNNIGELTQLWYVGVKNRKIALENGISSWKDPKCCADMLGINGVRANTLDKIIEINRDNIGSFLPSVITNNVHSWKNMVKGEVYVDFETMSDIFAGFDNLPIQKNTSMIFMIGVGWEDDKGCYKNLQFTCKEQTYEEEYRIMAEFVAFMKERDWPPAWYWCAEKNFWRIAEARQYNRLELEGMEEECTIIEEDWGLILYKLLDLRDVFLQEPITIKGCFNYGLKSIAKSMNKAGLISTKIESNCNSGMSAMINAWKYYKNANPSIMTDIQKYNNFDCKVLWDILSYLRRKHT